MKEERKSTPLTPDQFKYEINSRSYSQPFRMACMEAELTPYEFICKTIKDAKGNLAYEGSNSGWSEEEDDELPQDQLIDRLESLGHKYYEKLSNPKHREWVNTIRPQWGRTTMSPEARKYALNVLGILENYERNENRSK